jgi:protein-disulfide isomerase
MRILIFILTFLASPVLAAPPDRAATEAIIHDYLLAHPEIIPEALQALEDRKQAQAINANRLSIEMPFGAAWEGNPKGTVTLVEFFDYNCGYCRASVGDVERLLKEDKNLKVVYRELPVLGADSDAAALTSLSLALGSRQWPAFHRAVYANGDASAQSVAKAQKQVGIPINAAALKSPLMRDQINANLSLAQKLHITGTPSWVVGNKLLGGAVGYEELKDAIAEARAGGAKP